MNTEKKAVTDSGKAPSVKSDEMSHYNIAPEIIRAAAARSLEATATGGGCDYIVREVQIEEGKDPLIMVLGGEGAESPDKLDEKCFVSLKLSEDWTESIEFYFDTAVEGLDFMSKFSSSGSTNLGFIGQ